MDTTEFPCDLCGSDIAVEVPHARLYTGDQPIHICCKCGFVYVKNRRSAEAIARTWSDEIYGDSYTARIPAMLARQTYAADFIDVSIGLEGKSLFDIGAGEGQFLEIAQNTYGASVFGVEPSEANCKSLEKAGFNCFNGTIEEYVEKGEKREADIVTIIWTLENCVSCCAMLSAAYDSVKEGGHIAIATGSRLLVPFKKPLFDYFNHYPLDIHSFRFSANALQGLLAISGFETTHVNRYQDSEYLVVVGKKMPKGQDIPWQGDNYLKVYNFFERWHAETAYYL